MSKAERAAPAVAGSGGVTDSVAADPNRLTLRAVLHYLWQEADLATWSPRMAGKRNWRLVSWYLRQAAPGKFTKGKPLATKLYVPEPFNAEKKTETAARRLSAWAPMQQHDTSQQFMMLIGELEAIDPARFGHKLVIKHLPDASLMIDDTLPEPPPQAVWRRARAVAERRRGEWRQATCPLRRLPHDNDGGPVLGLEVDASTGHRASLPGDEISRANPLLALGLLAGESGSGFAVPLRDLGPAHRIRCAGFLEGIDLRRRSRQWLSVSRIVVMLVRGEIAAHRVASWAIGVVCSS